MKKLLQKIYCHTERQVININTNSIEIATYYKIFGVVVKTKSKPLNTEDYKSIVAFNNAVEHSVIQKNQHDLKILQALLPSHIGTI